MSSGPYTRFVAGVAFPLQEWLRGHSSASALRELERSQWLSRAELERLRVSRLRGLLGHARDRVPYYRSLFERHRFDPDRVESPGDLARLPLLTKDVIRASFADLEARGAKRMRLFSTTGSTGDPLRFLIGKPRFSRDIAAKWRATRWWGLDIGDREFVAWSSPIELTAQDRFRRARDFVLRSKLFPAIALTAERLDAFVAGIRAFRPRMLFGYPSSLTLAAQHARSKGIGMADLGIEVAFVTAERLYPHQRAEISTVFGCRVADGYGGRDSGFLSHECPEGGMHITAEDVILEIVDGEGRPLPAGEAGDVVVTHLFSHEFPFIRYKTGDVAVLDDRSCPCGRGLPLLREIQGRTNDFLVAESGARVHDVAFAMVLRDTPGVEQFKIVQETIERTRLQLVVGPGFDRARSLEPIERTFRVHLGAKVRVDVEFVPRIEPERTGKYRYVVSRVAT